MMTAWRMEFGIALAVAALAVAGCSSRPPPPPSPPSEPPRVRAFETFETGFDEVVRKYLDPVTIGPLAMEGIRGLGNLDPDLTATREDGVLTLMRGGVPLARIRTPGDDDVPGWAAVATEAAIVGTGAAPDLPPSEEVLEAVFDGMFSGLDVFSRYAGRTEAERNRAKRSGFDGIGISFRMVESGARIVGVMPDTPAATAGLRKNDVITHIDREPLAGRDTELVKDRLRGPSRSAVELLIEREDSANPLVYRIERRHIIAPTVVDTLEDGVLTLAITGFNHGTQQAVREVVEAARLPHRPSVRGIVLDLRGNPGGLLKQSIGVADLFLEGGRIVATRGRHPEAMQFYVADPRDIAAGLPVVVLVDGKTASAAEVVAAALEDNGRAVVVGTASYGKGSVQTVIRLPNDGEITLTWSRFITPAGTVLHRLGVRPAVCTSGLGENDAPEIALDPATRARNAELARSWRTVPAADAESRARLRDTCPPERRTGVSESRLARRLIAERALYRALLGVHDPAATAGRW